MANPQKEKGYTPIANELFEALARTRISGEATQVLNVIIRKTYGFNKKEDKISLSQFAISTEMSKTAVCKAIRKLYSMNIITKKGNLAAISYMINKDFDTWRPLPKKVTLPKKEIDRTKKVQKSYQKSDIQKTVSKDTITKDTIPASSTKLIEAFRPINRSHKAFYSDPKEIRACHDLIEAYGFDMVIDVIPQLAKTNGVRYFPVITTPRQLLEKWSALESALRRKEADEDENRPGKVVDLSKLK